MTWTITYSGVEQSAAAWGLNAAPKITTRDRSATKISFRMAGAAPENGVPFPFKAQVVIRQNRVYAGGAWSGSGYVFTGYQTTQPGDVDGRGQGITLVFQDAIWLMQNTTFQQLWTVASAPSTPVYVARCVLFMDINSWVPNLYQSVQWQINQIITYAASCGISIAAGTIDYSGWYLNYYHCRAMSCWEALLKCLEPIPDAKVWVDGSTGTPTLNVRTRANLAALSTPSGTGPGPITLPYKGTDSAGRSHFSTRGYTPRYDLVIPQVVLQYQINNTIDGKSAPMFTDDVYPATVGGSTDGQMPFAMVCPIDLTGSTMVTETGTLDCEPVACIGGTHAAKRAWWAAKRGGEQDKLADYRVRFGSATIGDATVVDDSGNPISLSSYPNRIVSGTYHSWMSNGSTAIVAIRAHIKVTVSFSEYDLAGGSESDTTTGNLTRKANSHEIHCHVTLTNAPAGKQTYSDSNFTAYAESPVANLAQNIYTSRAVLDYDGSHEIVDPGIRNGSGATQPLQQIIGHWNVLNLSGGATAWATANMTIASTEIDLMTNHIRIETGPAKHLQPQDWNSMLQYFRYRRVLMPSSLRATGYSGAGNSADMPLNTADGNTVAGLAVDQIHTLSAPDATQTGLSTLFSQNATTGQITRTQFATPTAPATVGTPITTGTIAPEYTGSGAPTSTTLPSGSYYRVGDKYIDTSAGNIYRCTTAGGSSGGGSAVWAQIGGGVQQFVLVSDGGDYWNCHTWNGTTAGGTVYKVAKPYKLRCVNGPASEAIRGTTYTYTYALSGIEYVRSTSVSGSPLSTEYMTPAVLAGDIIYASPFSTGAPSTLAGVILLDINADGRAWATSP